MQINIQAIKINVYKEFQWQEKISVRFIILMQSIGPIFHMQKL